jgi:NDP-sugar pyrophosphorylase family protein
MLLRAATLRAIPRLGYFDFKEQALPSIAAKHDVRVVPLHGPSVIPIRSLGDYIRAARHYHGALAGKSAAAVVHFARSQIEAEPFDGLCGIDGWRSFFSIIENEAVVDPTAHLHDSVVLAGATVEAGAIVVRSLVAPGAIVRRDQRAVETIVTSDPKARRKAA